MLGLVEELRQVKARAGRIRLALVGYGGLWSDDDQQFHLLPWAVQQAAIEPHNGFMIELAGASLPDTPALWRGYRQALATDAGAEMPEALLAVS